MIQFTFWLTILVVLIQGKDKVLLDVAYTREENSAQTLDMYLPEQKNFSTIVFVHEGSLTGGDKKDEPIGKIAAKFQADGICFVSINYRLGPAHAWPSQPDDVATAFAWVKNNISQYNGDPTRIFIVGHSSGALLASLVSTDKKYLLKQQLELKHIAGFVAIGTQLKAVLPAVAPERLPEFFKKIDYLRIFGDTATFQNAAPLRHITADMPPGLILIADKEQFNPPLLEQAKEFVEKSNKYNRDVRYEVIPERTHMSNVSKMVEENDPVYALLKNFIQSH